MNFKGILDLALKNRGDRAFLDVPEALQENDNVKNIPLERLPEERKRINIGSLSPESRKRTEKLVKKVNANDPVKRGTMATRKIVQFGKAMLVDADGHIISGPVKENNDQNSLRQIEHEITRNLTKESTHDVLNPSKNPDQNPSIQCNFASTSSNLPSIGSTAEKPGSSRHAEFVEFNIIDKDHQLETIIKQNEEILTVLKCVLEKNQLLSTSIEICMEKINKDSLLFDVLYQRINTPVIEMMEKITELYTNQSDSITSAINQMAMMVSRIGETIGGSLNQIVSSVQGLKRFIASFDAHLADMSHAASNTYQSAFNPPTMAGPTIQEAKVVLATDQHKIDVAGKTTLSAKLTAFKAATNMSDIDVFSKVPGYAEARRQGDDIAAINAIDIYVNETKRRGE